MYTDFETLIFPEGDIFSGCEFTDFSWKGNTLTWSSDIDPESFFEAKVLYQLGKILVCEFI